MYHAYSIGITPYVQRMRVETPANDLSSSLPAQQAKAGGTSTYLSVIACGEVYRSVLAKAWGQVAPCRRGLRVGGTAILRVLALLLALAGVITPLVHSVHLNITFISVLTGQHKFSGVILFQGACIAICKFQQTRR